MRTFIGIIATTLLLGCSAVPPRELLGSDGGAGGSGGADGTSSSGGAGSGSGAGGSSESGGHTSSSSGGPATSSSSSTSTSTSSSGSTSTSSSSGGTTGACQSGPPPSNPACYWEPVCPDAPLGDLAQAFTGGNWLSTALEMTNRRYPSARCLIDQYAGDVGNYVDNSSFAALAESLMTMVHEETHGFDYDHAGAGTFAYYARCDLAVILPRIDGFPRSEILPLVEGNGTSLYDGTYLTGEQGTYGFAELLDEWNAYLDGMAAIGLVGDHVTSGISGTDGAVAFAYYVELYLRVARTQHPAVYAQIKGSAPTVAFLRQQWNRLHFFLGLADAYPNLAIEAGAIKQVLYADANRGELEMVIGAPLGAGSCN